MKFLFISGVILLFILVYWLAYRSDKKRWNVGYCRECGGKWKQYDTDSQGGRMYKCPKNHRVDISYPVDNL